jgi:hypothetical protein
VIQRDREPMVGENEAGLAITAHRVLLIRVIHDQFSTPVRPGSPRPGCASRGAVAPVVRERL